MRMHYNFIAGQSLERLAALSDGIFAVSMTLLVLNLQVPAGEVIHSEHDLLGALLKLLPSLVTYLMSFMTLGIFWVGQQSQLSHFTRSDRHLTWMHLGFLLAVSLTPFSTALLAGFITSRVAIVVYWLNILFLGVALLCSLLYGERAGLMKQDTTTEVQKAYKRRIIIAQSLYALGALLCLINTYVSIAIILLVQLNYVIAPRIRPLDRL